jgi:hypothetical protein
MINFFRKIRHQLANENKFQKYFRYAIGEIVLVVIGILIALQINNWNQSKIQHKKEVIILNELKKGLESDLNNEFIPGIAYYNESKEALNKLDDFYKINDIAISNDSLTQYYQTYLRDGEWNFVFNTAAFENLKSMGMDVISNDSLRSKISAIYSYEYPDLKERGSRGMRFYENQISPVLNNKIDRLKPVFSIDDLNTLKNDIQITNRFRDLNSWRKLLVIKTDKVKNEVELLINLIIKEIDRN